MSRPRTDRTARAPHVELVEDVLIVSGSDLDQVLTEVGARLGPDAEVLDARREIVGGIAGFFGREQFTVEARAAEDDLAPAAAPQVHPEPDPAHGAAEPDAGHREHLDGPSFAAALATALAEVDEVVATAAPLVAPPVPVEPGVDELHAGLEPSAMDLLHEPERTPPAQIEPAPVAAADRSPRGTTALPVTPELSWDEGALLALTAPDLSTRQLTEQLGQLVGEPPALPRRGIVAVVGDPSDALATAEALATAAGMEPGDVLLAAPAAGESRPAWLTVTDTADAAARRERWSARKGVTVVAVAMHPGLDGLSWTRDMLDALGADQVRLAVPGWRHVDEVLPRLRGLHHVDAIDLCSPVDATAAIGFIGLPVPIGTIAGRPATVAVWLAQLRPGATDAPDSSPTTDAPEEARR